MEDIGSSIFDFLDKHCKDVLIRKCIRDRLVSVWSQGLQKIL